MVIAVTVLFSVLMVAGLKLAHDKLRERNARLIDRYVEVVGRISALLIGTIAIDKVLEGLDGWLVL